MQICHRFWSRKIFQKTSLEIYLIEYLILQFSLLFFSSCLEVSPISIQFVSTSLVLSFPINSEVKKKQQIEKKHDERHTHAFYAITTSLLNLNE